MEPFGGRTIWRCEVSPKKQFDKREFRLSWLLLFWSIWILSIMKIVNPKEYSFQYVLYISSHWFIAQQNLIIAFTDISQQNAYRKTSTKRTIYERYRFNCCILANLVLFWKVFSIKLPMRINHSAVCFKP